MSGHVPVLLEEVLEILAPRDDGIYLDGTFGGGGYAEGILKSAACTLWAIDRDPAAVQRGLALAARYPGRLHMLEGCFGDMLDLLSTHGVVALDGIVLDLGVSSFQLDQPERGFSFRADGPLDMRMSTNGPSAADLVATLSEGELADVFYHYGEERHARRVARAVVAARAVAPIETTLQLADIVRRVVPRDASGIDRATRSFQGLRIRVNDELGEIERAMAAALKLLAPHGRLIVVSFHSLEDRIVKKIMAEASGRSGIGSRHTPAAFLPRAVAEYRLLTTKPVFPGEAELASNARARSARLRAIERVVS